jgi:hypothetical protein
MHRWRVQVRSSDPQLLSYLIASLQDTSIRIIEEDGQYYLVSSNFEFYQSLTQFQGLSACADRIIARLNSLLKLQFQVHSGIFKINPALYVDDIGLLHLVIMDTIQLTDEVKGYSGDNYFQDASRIHPDLIPRWLEEGTDRAVDDALRYYANETNWFNLYKVYEVIKNDAEIKGVTLKLLTKNNTERFKYSANNANASGDAARHSLAEFPNKAKLTPLSLGEAENYIDKLLTEWLEAK